jgi:hypothetical protein
MPAPEAPASGSGHKAWETPVPPNCERTLSRGVIRGCLPHQTGSPGWPWQVPHEGITPCSWFSAPYLGQTWPVVMSPDS